jgi:hypothetical protein
MSSSDYLGVLMRHLEGESRDQIALLPESLEDFVASDHPVRVIDAYVDALDRRGKYVGGKHGAEAFASV